ncbi:hypothetical protein BV25DRAFT_1826072 [Artomyces pyxidatus]|uniref:Uncharacterized protein n=1 Tax=Artomyces pyxidatus TaxID=48021 RepID=A0ACB8SZG5_9AGAM|nr:hypothetical protein BV25DRAFT_1826072 [Artomyces pyxidatus]
MFFLCSIFARAGRVCWVTQLVRRNYRRRGIACRLMKTLKHDTYTALGIASSHPAACLALLNAAGIYLKEVDLGFIQAHAREILTQLRGTIFELDPVDPPWYRACSPRFTLSKRVALRHSSRGTRVYFAHKR